MTTTTKIQTTWTLAYRNPRANHFKRVTNWSGTWAQAREMAAEFGKLDPALQIWYVPDAANEQRERDMIASGELPDLGYSEDWGKVMVGNGHRDRKTGEWVSGKRVKIRETGSLPAELLALDLSGADERWRQEASS